MDELTAELLSDLRSQAVRLSREIEHERQVQAYLRARIDAHSHEFVAAPPHGRGLARCRACLQSSHDLVHRTAAAVLRDAA